MEIKGILAWAFLLMVCGAVILFSRKLKKEIEQNGIEAKGVISRIEDKGGPDEIDLQYYVRYRTEDGETIEGLLSNPTSDLQVGQPVDLKYHPKYKANARLIR